MPRREGRRQDELAKFSAIEEEGRSRSSARDSIPKGDDEFLTRMNDASNQMSQYFSKMGESNFATLMYRVGSAADYNRTLAWKCEGSGTPRAECMVSENAKDRLKYADEGARLALEGKKCTWMLGDPDLGEPYTLNKFLNDLTACFHRGVEKYGVMAKQWHRHGKCMWRE